MTNRRAAADFPIVVKLGGRKAVAEYLATEGLPIGITGLGMHVSRGVIPGDISRALMKKADGEGIAYTAADFQLAQRGAGVNEAPAEPDAGRADAKAGPTRGEVRP